MRGRVRLPFLLPTMATIIQSDKYKLVTAPTVEPVTTAEAKTHMRVTTAADDTYINALVTSARQQAEMVLRKSLITTTWDLYFEDFASELHFEYGPLQSITSIKYQDENNAEQTLSTSNYAVSRADRGLNRIKILSAPATYADGFDSVIVRFVAGYGNAASDVPEVIKTALKVRVNTWYDVRQEIIVGSQVNKIDGWFEDMLNTELHHGHF